MISSVTSSDNRRRSSAGSVKIAPIDRGSVNRQIEAIYNEDSDSDGCEKDVEAPVSRIREPSPPHQNRVLRSSTRRRSSVERTRRSIMRVLNNTNKSAPRHTLFDTMLSPVDMLLGSGVDDISLDADVHDDWQKKREIEVSSPWYIIHPSSKFRLVWDLVMAALLSVLAFYIPFRVCFYWNDVQDEEPLSIFWLENSIDMLFALDIIFNFFTAYQDKNGFLVTDPKKIALKYVKGFFFIDLIATIPFGIILTHSSFSPQLFSKLGKLGRIPKLIRFAKAARLLKLLRVYKLADLIMRLEVEYNIHHGISRMIKIVMLIMLVTHLVGCFWFLIGLGGDEEDMLNAGWVYRYYLDQSPKAVQYVASMYWAFSTLTTVGYGDISARIPQEQIYAMVMMLVGVSWYAYIVSSISTIMSSFDAQNKAIRDKMLCVNEFVRTAKLPKDLSKQVLKFFEFKLARSQHAFLISSNYNVDELLDELGSGLRADVLLYMDRHLIEKIPFLQNKVPQFVADIISMFQPMVFQEGDFICKEGTQADEMFFLVKGSAGIYYGSKLIVVIEEGNYFGEIGCIMGGIRRAGVKALSTVELQALSRRNLNILLVEYPEVGDELKRVARERANEAKKDKTLKSSQRESQIVSRSQSSGQLRTNADATSASEADSKPDLKVDISTERKGGVQDDAASVGEYNVLLEKEIDTIVQTLSRKLRHDLADSARIIPQQGNADGIG